MTFLELCATLTRESGAVGNAPSNVTGQTGRQAKAVAWVADAWGLIQSEQTDWCFLRKEFEGPLITDTTIYAGATLGLTDHAQWLGNISIYPDGDQGGESELRRITYDRWRRTYNFGTHDANRPVQYAISPNEELCVGPKPDAAYIARGEYIRTPQVLSANGDVPLMPARFHPAIVKRAKMLLCAHDEAWDALKAATAEYDLLYDDMLRDLLPAITTGGNALR